MIWVTLGIICLFYIFAILFFIGCAKANNENKTYFEEEDFNEKEIIEDIIAQEAINEDIDNV